jgi:hypothetical protein
VDITNRARESAVQEANKLLYTQQYSNAAASIVDVDSAILWRERALLYEEQLSRLGITLAPHTAAAAAGSSSTKSSAVKASNLYSSGDFSASRKATAAAAALTAGGSASKLRSSAAHREHVVASLACFEHSMLVQQGVSQRLELQLSRAKQALAAAQAAAAPASVGAARCSTTTTTTTGVAESAGTEHDAATDTVIEETIVQPDATTTTAATETASARVQATLIANATAQAQRRAALQQRTSSPNVITDASSSSAGPRCEFSTAYTSAAHSFRTPVQALLRPQLHNGGSSGTAGAAAGLKVTYEPKSPELRSWLAQHRAAVQQHVRTLG